MNFDPQNFFISLMDFFSILLPGALLTYLLMDEVGPVALGDRYANLAGARAWAAFLFASHLFGHLIFLLSSWQNDLYDWGAMVMDDLSSAIHPNPLNIWLSGYFNENASYSFMACIALSSLEASWQLIQSEADLLWQCS